MARVIAGDCLREMEKLARSGTLVDAIVTDPPYHLIQASRGGSPRQNNPATRVLSSGGFMGQRWDGGDIAFRPETWAAIGAVLKPGGYLLAFGGTRTHHRIWCAIEDAGFVIQDTIMWLYGQGFPKGRAQLKPAHEPICVAYKPGGPRALNIDECRIILPADSANARRHKQGEISPGYGRGWIVADSAWNGSSGRWPANLCHDGSDEVMEAFAAFGDLAAGNRPRIRQGGVWNGKGQAQLLEQRMDSGTAARFFYCAKAGKADRAGSKHPTVKPIALMRWLVRLVTPPGGTVLDPFAGSGTTGAAALAEGRRCILIEREAEYIADIRRRVA